MDDSSLSDQSNSMIANISAFKSKYSAYYEGERSQRGAIRTHTMTSPQKNATNLMKKATLDSADRRKKLRALIVDDDSFNIMSIEMILKRLNIQYDSCFNGKEAIKKVISNNNYDIILMDCNMPVMDGWEATKAIVDLVDRA